MQQSAYLPLMLFWRTNRNAPAVRHGARCSGLVSSLSQMPATSEQDCVATYANCSISLAKSIPPSGCRSSLPVAIHTASSKRNSPDDCNVNLSQHPTFEGRGQTAVKRVTWLAHITGWDKGLASLAWMPNRVADYCGAGRACGLQSKLSTWGVIRTVPQKTTVA